MGVDTKIFLPPDVRVNDVADVIGILSGLKPVWHPFDKPHSYVPKDAGYVRVPGVTVRSIFEPSMVEIILQQLSDFSNLIDGEMVHHAYYHFETHNGSRLLIPPSTPYWVSIGIRLVDFFGGYVDFDDCDDVYRDYIVKTAPLGTNSPENGLPYYEFQQKKLNLTPLSIEDLKANQRFAVYLSQEVL